MAHLGHGTSNSNKIFLFNYLINRIQKRVTKMRQLLQVATILLQNATIITKYDVYYKLPQYTLNVVF